MDHTYIAEQDVAGRYMSGTLPSDERSRFEEHFIDCPRCLDALEEINRFQQALRTVAAEHAAPATGTRAVRPGRPWTHRATRVAGVAAAAAIAIGGVDLLRTRRELARVSAVSADLERRYVDSENVARGLSNRIRSLERVEPRSERPGMDGESNAPVFPLTKVRGDGAAPTNRIVLSTKPQWIVLLVELADALPFNRYRATLRTAGGRDVWAGDRLAASTPEALGISLHSTLFASGDYVLTVEGQASNSPSWTRSGRYTFRVTR
jgi:hypothetical protein